MEGRTLITLDLDFSNPFRFSPMGNAGTIILRPHRPSPLEIDSLFDETLRRLHGGPVDARIWIIEPGRIRVYATDEEKES